MLKNPKISIIVPVYNVEKYLRAALDSLIKQTYSNIEIVCVNDGSSDNSLTILNEYAQKDNRIIVLNKENEGVAVARNNGLDIATGQYIMFCDADDKFYPYACQKVVDKILLEEVDIVAFGHDLTDKDEFSTNVVIENKLACKKSKAKLKTWIALQVFVWGKAFKKSFLKENNITFPAGIKCAEDVVFCLLSYFAKPKYSFIAEPLYLYTDSRVDSATTDNTNCIANDFEAYKTLFLSERFQAQPTNVQVVSTNHFLGGSVNYWRNRKSQVSDFKLLDDIKQFSDFVEQNFSKYECRKMKNLQKLKSILFKAEHISFFKLFNYEKSRNYKIFTIFGQIFKLRRSI